jgi:hypothetical protein
MTAMESVAVWIGIAAIVSGAVAAAVGLFTILSKRDDWYRAQHRRFLDRRDRVEQELNRKRHG